MKSWLFLLLFLPGAAFAQKTTARVDCKYTGKDFVYDCLIRLQPPVEGARVTMSADMPSMPLAHQVRPVQAQPTKTPGEYRARLELEMTGEWAVKLRLSGAVRDVLVLHYEFTEAGTAPRK
jgi:hypothetical protein